MRSVAVILASLACSSHARSTDNLETRRLKLFDSLLFAASPAIEHQRLVHRSHARSDSHRRLTPQMKLNLGKMFNQVTFSAAGVALAALLAFGTPDMAEAARSGGRVGGRAPAARSMPRSSSSSNTNVYVNPQPSTNIYVSPGPSLFPGGGYGYGYGYGGYGGFGGGGISTGTYLGLSLVDTFIREQQRQQYLQQQLRVQQELGKDQAQIAQLQAELAQQRAKVDNMRQESPNVEKDAMAKMQEQLNAQKQELDQLKAPAR
eukprot:CAMPEP_0169140850 /NCGR_PEP_ID=MMETSP1015-20121227/43884_1 /TAXON_ID=342587 /ORGANISM="Karlodinium micrum, Strain CCMP2283" /LENGTH=260 /DNA_ID=CAMNT_0009206973 /DNA_START=52 /DNA_END=834 /DNA_ORIENTATION=-